MVVLVVVLAALAGAARAGALSYATVAGYVTGPGPSGVVVGDFNGDHLQDLAVADHLAKVSILLGKADGTFDASTNLSVGTTPRSLAVGDFNGDGKQDLAVADNGAASVTVLLGDGTGAFGSKTDYTAGAGAYSVAVGDLNGDGKQDLAVSNSQADTVSVLLGDGSGGFGAKTDFATADFPMSVAIGDLNGDGKKDLVTANDGADNASVLLGNGDGTFQAKTDVTAGTSPTAVQVADFNGDGKRDLVVANDTSGNVSVLLGNGNGTFAAKTDFGAGSRPWSVAVGDLDGDGHQDLAVAEDGGAGVSVLLGDGAGGFSAATHYATGTVPFGVAIGAFGSGDQVPDLAVADYGDSKVGVLTGLWDTPSGTMMIDGGAAETSNPSVTIESAVAEATTARLCEQIGAWSAWAPYAASGAWMLSSGDGVKTVHAQYQGNSVSTQTLELSDTIVLDTHGPTTKAKAATGKKDRYVTLRYFVTDNLSARVSDVTLTVKNRRGKVVKTVTLGTKSTGAWHERRWKPSARGTYTFRVSAVDQAGNKQSKSTKATVKIT